MSNINAINTINYVYNVEYKIEHYIQKMTDSVNDMELPSVKALSHAAKVGIMDDRPLMLDYWGDSIDKKVFIGIRENQEKLLVKSQDEYTSPISKIFKVENNYIIMTENSIYIVKADIPNKKIS